MPSVLPVAEWADLTSSYHLQEASRLEAQTTARLKQTKKLSLIVDLDQTIIHATVDPTVGEWLDDPENPNFSALNNTGKFKLGDEDDTCWYYVKQRSAFLHPWRWSGTACR